MGQQNSVLDKLYNNYDDHVKFTSNLIDILLVARLDGRIRVFFYEHLSPAQKQDFTPMLTPNPIAK